MTAISRRRAISLTAAAAGVALLPGGSTAASGQVVRQWRGAALGTQASIKIVGLDERRAAEVIAACVTEIRRLEAEFSLFREDSALCRLNAAGEFKAPSADMLRLLGDAINVANLSDGAFDPTVQPLWRLYADHFENPKAPAQGPSHASVERTLRRVDWRRISAAPAAIRLGAGQALTFNGIAQGFITDRIADLLRAAGLRHVLINLGEFRALGPRAPGKPWRIALADGDVKAPARSIVPLAGGAVATSGGGGLRFDKQGRFHHLIDPHNGLSPARYRSVSVIAKTATIADALSTALTMMPPDTISQLLRRAGGEAAHVTFAGGGRATFHADA